ncbi:MFS transporter [Proteiniphilum propionicum]|uniref:MFS transporter n=1 Tax=Proteiniphilum propionicum TaxID=2829812 RepID=UPI002111C2B0|nr:MFS transporter [Proteiniphilum propionicum]
MQNTIKAKLSAMMFFQFFIQGSWYVTMGTYLGRTLNFSGVQIGLAYSTAAIAAIISPVIVGMIADRFFSANRVLAFLNVLGAFLLFWLTKVQTFSLFFPILLFYSICFMPTMSLTNSISFANLIDPAKEFSRIRLFGSFGWIGAGLLISALDLEIYSTPFLIGAGVSLLAGLFALILPYRAPVQATQKITIGQMLGFNAFKLIKDRSFLVLLAFFRTDLYSTCFL